MILFFSNVPAVDIFTQARLMRAQALASSFVGLQRIPNGSVDVVTPAIMSDIMKYGHYSLLSPVNGPENVAFKHCEQAQFGFIFGRSAGGGRRAAGALFVSD
ncbi:hypothetical protein EVAR_90164_1 [Eumeta japonica]|uniref:Uncharacterized protein n=1 Tax=Eumeta variegata TaxID=151549 RepID=A0A4C1WW54_EUMVA|nr:hypothetical protein EVAR_90164_1 [Eumeta japonica]